MMMVIGDSDGGHSSDGDSDGDVVMMVMVMGDDGVMVTVMMEMMVNAHTIEQRGRWYLGITLANKEMDQIESLHARPSWRTLRSGAIHTRFFYIGCWYARATQNLD